MDERQTLLQQKLQALKEQICIPVSELTAEAWVTKEPVPYTDRMQGRHIMPKTGDSWGELWDCAWFHFTGQAPDHVKGKKLVFRIDLSGEGCIFEETGTPVRGITNVASDFARYLGMPGKRIVPFTDCAAGGDRADFWLEAGCNDLFGKYCDNGTILNMEIAVCRDDARDLYYDLLVLLNFAQHTDDETRREEVLCCCEKAFDTLDEVYSAASAAESREITAAELARKNEGNAFHITALGHAHMDLAWLWPIRETKRKCGRTFSTLNALMDRYPDYHFGASQPQQLVWIQENYPGLFDKIKQRYREGRFELQGGFWVECDTNVTGGESLVRQLVYGKRYFREEFGYEQEMLWLPDVFGYSAQIPQLMKKAGLKYFMTIKMSWSRVNKIPHHTCKWQAIDGSEVLAHMPPEGTYNSPGNPWAVLTSYRNFADKDVSDETLMLFGIGDGGGGPGPEHLEVLKREKDFLGLPRVDQGFAVDFFRRIEKNMDRYST